jgi:nicotinate-nucleotide--dimethylbenzimidazole phosphoribosyltransferase
MSAHECDAALVKWRRDRAQAGRRRLQRARLRRDGHRQHRLRLADHARLLTGTPLDDCVGRGTGLDDAGLARKRDLLQQGRRTRRAAGRRRSDERARRIRRLRDRDDGRRHARRGRTRHDLLIDGFIVTSALLVAARIAPAIRDYCVFCHRSAEPGHLGAAADARAEPLIDLGLRLGEGTGAALAWPLVSAAVAFLNEMASFESAGVSEKG